MTHLSSGKNKLYVLPYARVFANEATATACVKAKKRDWLQRRLTKER